jgi:hypothetical protein
MSIPWPAGMVLMVLVWGEILYLKGSMPVLVWHAAAKSSCVSSRIIHVSQTPLMVPLPSAE